MNTTLKILTALTASLTKDLEEGQSRLLDSIGGISIIDLDGKYIDINEKYANDCGYSPDELIGKNWTITVHPDDLQLAIDAYKELEHKREVFVKIRGVNKSGGLFEKTVTFIRRNDLQGKMNGHYCMMTKH